MKGGEASHRESHLHEQISQSQHLAQVALAQVACSQVSSCWNHPITSQRSLRFAHATASSTTQNSIYHLAWEPYHNYTVPCQECSTSVVGHHSCRMQLSSTLQQKRRMTCFWRQLTHNITIHISRLSLKEGCFEINVKKIPSLTGCHLTTHSKSGSCGNR